MKRPLSKRLAAVAERVPQGARVADIGADHAHLSAYLVETGRAARVIATDVSADAFGKTRKRLEALDPAKAEARFGDGLSVIELGEVDVVIVAGMGGRRTVEILDGGANGLASAGRLVLQPLTLEPAIRRWLYANGWRLTDEELLEERGRHYEVIVAEPGDPSEAYDDLPIDVETAHAVGPILWRNRHPALRDKWETRRQGLRRTLPPSDARLDDIDAILNAIR